MGDVIKTGLGLIVVAVVVLVWVGKMVSDEAPGAAPASTSTFGPTDLGVIIDTARSNEPRFKRDYHGQAFVGPMGFRSVGNEWSFSGGTYQVELGSGYFGNVHCFVNKDAADRMIDWRSGQRVYVNGIIDDTVLGSLRLKPCSVNRAVFDR